MYSSSLIIRMVKLSAGPSDRAVLAVGLDRLDTEFVGSNPA